MQELSDYVRDVHRASHGVVHIIAGTTRVPSTQYSVLPSLRLCEHKLSPNHYSPLTYSPPSGFGHFKCLCKKSNVPTPLILWGPTKDSIWQRSDIFSLTL